MTENQTIEGAGRTADNLGRRHRRRMTLRERFEKHIGDYVGGQMYVTDESLQCLEKCKGAYRGTIDSIAFNGDILNIHLSWAAKKNSGLGWAPHDRLDYSFNWDGYTVNRGKFREYRLSSISSGELVEITTKWNPYKVEPPDE